MSTKTTNLNLIKPEKTDPADILVLNDNWDKIDTKLKDIDDTIAVQPNKTDYYEATLV